MGSVVVVPAGEVHGFTASPGGPLRMTCLHLNDRMITEWVERGQSSSAGAKRASDSTEGTV